MNFQICPRINFTWSFFGLQGPISHTYFNIFASIFTSEVKLKLLSSAIFSGLYTVFILAACNELGWFLPLSRIWNCLTTGVTTSSSEVRQNSTTLHSLLNAFSNGASLTTFPVSFIGSFLLFKFSTSWVKCDELYYYRVGQQMCQKDPNELVGRPSITGNHPSS